MIYVFLLVVFELHVDSLLNLRCTRNCTRFALLCICKSDDAIEMSIIIVEAGT